jgi:SAM-dependent methyltransferase
VTAAKPNFDEHVASYEEEIERAIAFSGREHDFFVEAKTRALVDLARRRLGDPGSLGMLDVGCGPGLTDRFLVPHVGSLQGVDVVEGMVARARRQNPGVRYEWYDGTGLPYPDRSFDVSFASCVFHHVAEGEHAGLLGEMRRVTRPGGFVVVFEHNSLNPLTQRVVRNCDFDKGVTLIPRGRMVGLFEAAGLSVAETRFVLFFPWRPRLLAALERRLAWLPLGAQYLVAGTSTG